ncbi:IclR family transcriptional regulator [Peptoniphilus equinus]|uniref:IclR family transcriptional regulator n=1 Tax=Peptoniphilus equinus TaxID=3016343 RepID=A0ABY7QTV2_9FIRM|nr:IclR family transcriptional regulator [Peptoniphilus equinus]WBW50208.1 IclR family transcriptional regulator [Peptoniphilus equinus]
MEVQNQSIERVFLILEAFQKFPNGAGLTELSNAVGLHKSTVHRFLMTLVSLGYVTKKDNKYSLTYKLYTLASTQFKGTDLVEVSEQEMNRLALKVNEVVHLVIRDGIYGVYINKIEANNAITMGSRIGARMPLLRTSVGKAMLAFEPDEIIQTIYTQSVKEGIIDAKTKPYETILADIERTRRTGVGIDDEDNEPGIYCVGAAILDFNHQVLGAISITGPKNRMLEKIKNDDLKDDVFQTAKIISNSLGYNSFK